MSIPQRTPRRKRGRPATVVRVQCFERSEGTRYCVARQTGANTIIYEQPDFVTEFAAYLAAARRAAAVGARLDAPEAMKSRLVAFWMRRGRWLFLTDRPRSFCANKYERQAYDQAEAELMACIEEKDSKPGLSDYVPMEALPGEYCVEASNG